MCWLAPKLPLSNPWKSRVLSNETIYVLWVKMLTVALAVAIAPSDNFLSYYGFYKLSPQGASPECLRKEDLPQPSFHLWLSMGPDPPST